MNQNKLILPGAIVIASLLIGGALIYTRTPQGTQNTQGAAAAQSAEKPASVTIKPVVATDHILGNPNAKVVMVEYSDLECPFCKRFQTTMQQVIGTYGKDSTVAWVYRQFPIPSLHPKAPKESEASECVNELGGNVKFWQYIDKIYEITPSNNGLDPAQLVSVATGLGIDKKAFNSCLDSGKYTQAITEAYNDAIAAGGQGTPYTVVLTKDPITDVVAKRVTDIFTAAATQYNLAPNALGYISADKKVIFNGNLPYELVQQVVAALIS